ncbi:restriction endonuclease subunit S [Staphylococcus simulans]|uniref:restriction endonuclease subunit S n=1 Tax=Staphylococcus simulans TaxID=1286 RepID=UPI000D1DABFF|nr:restriction endonuclease subunit S [Staphylococcus simulans]PTJ29626.1 restriction endonuclease subunit S [Staphylococcus simulans]
MSKKNEHKPNVPELRFPEFSGEWKEKKLGEVCTFTSGGTPLRSKTEYWNGTIPWITTGDINGTKIKSVNNFITKEGLDNSSAKLIEETAILVAMYGQGKTRGMSSILNFSAATNQACAVLKTKENHNFLHQFLLKNYYKLRFLANEGSQKNLSLSLLKEFKIFITNYNEQQKIGNFFNKLDRQIELEEQKLALLEEQKKGYMQKIFSQELRFKDENGNEYPEWEERLLGELLIRGNKDSVIDKKNIRRITVKLHGQGLQEVIQDRETKDTRPFYRRYKGELIIGKQNFFNGSIAIISSEFDGFICSNAIMSYKFRENVNSRLLLNYLLRHDFLKKNEYLADGTGQKELSEKKFENLKVTIPKSIEEQLKISEVLKRFDLKINRNKRKIKLFKERKGTLRRCLSNNIL